MTSYSFLFLNNSYCIRYPLCGNLLEKLYSLLFPTLWHNTWQNNLRDKRFILAQFQRIESQVAWPHVRGQNIMATRVLTEIVLHFLVYRKQKERKRLETWYNLLRPTSSDLLPPATSYSPLPKGSTPSQNSATSWGSSIQNMNLRGHFILHP